MPITDADFPIIDQQADLKIDNSIERVYLYTITSSANSTAFPVNLRFYKYKEKFNGQDTFISESNTIFIWINNSNRWSMSNQIGNSTNGITRTTAGIEGLYRIPNVTLARITSDTR